MTARSDDQFLVKAGIDGKSTPPTASHIWPEARPASGTKIGRSDREYIFQLIREGIVLRQGSWIP